MSGNTPYAPVDSDVSPALLPLAAQQAVSVSTSVSTSASGWTTGDYKISSQAADHDDVGGGKWLICDATAIDATYAALIALVGATRPDARGRTLVMQGTNAAVNTVGANDGVAVANRRPQHRHTAHSHTITSKYNPMTNGAGFNALSGDPSAPNGPINVANSGSNGTADGGSGTGTDSLDAPAFLVPGNLFIHT